MKRTILVCDLCGEEQDLTRNDSNPSGLNLAMITPHEIGPADHDGNKWKMDICGGCADKIGGTLRKLMDSIKIKKDPTP